MSKADSGSRPDCLVRPGPSQPTHLMGEEGGIVDANSTWAILMTIVATVALTGWWESGNKSDKRKKEKKDRGRLLRIMPQLGIGEFRRVIVELGWIKKIPVAGVEKPQWVYRLPQANFGPPILIGAVFASIIASWKYLNDEQTEPLPDMRSLVLQLLEQYDEGDQADFIIGMTRKHKEIGEKMQRLLSIERSCASRKKSEESIDRITAAGLRASSSFIPRK